MWHTDRHRPDSAISRRLLIVRPILNMTQLRKSLLLVIGFAVIAGVAGFFYAPWWDTSWQRLLLCIASFGCFGMLLGGIYAFDAESDLKIRVSAIGRITI